MSQGVRESGQQDLPGNPANIGGASGDDALVMLMMITTFQELIRQQPAMAVTIQWVSFRKMNLTTIVR